MERLPRFWLPGVGCPARTRWPEGTIDGPFFTEDEARVSADLLRGTFRGARAYEVNYDRIWNYDPRREQVTFDQARMSRSLLAIRLCVQVPTNSATGALE